MITTKLITDIYETKESEMDDYNHEMPAHQKLLSGLTWRYIKI